jgi:cytochrome c peroxidase
MMRKPLFAAIAAVFAVSAAHTAHAVQTNLSAELREKAKAIIQPIEPAKIEHPAKVDLGRQLFFEPRLSMSGIISCNTCHNLSLGGVDNLKTSIGHK